MVNIPIPPVYSYDHAHILVIHPQLTMHHHGLHSILHALRRIFMFLQQPLDHHAGRFPEVMILTTPTDEMLYAHTYSQHQAFEKAGTAHIYREFTAQGSATPLGHVFNVLEPQQPESIAANQVILEWFASRTVD